MVSWNIFPILSRNNIPMQLYRYSGKMFVVRTTPELAAQKAKYKKAFTKRTMVAREGTGMEDYEMAAELNVKPDTYYRYEHTVVMPHFLLPRFILLTEVTADYMLGLSRHKRKSHLKSV